MLRLLAPNLGSSNLSTLRRSASLPPSPQAFALEASLKQLALDLADATAKPFRVDMIRVRGGNPPIYCVVIPSSAKDRLR